MVAGWNRLDAFSSEFWDKKPPSEWTSDEIGKLTTKSPWAKQVSAQVAAGGGGGGRGGMGGGGGMGGPRIGGGIPGMGGPRMGGGGMGGGGMGGGRRGGGQMQQMKGTVRWESAQTILDAVKTPLPEAFANHYVISVSGFPLRGGGRRQDDDSDSGDNSRSREDMLDNLKAYTSLQPKGKAIAQPGVVKAQVSSGPGSLLFGFSKEALELSADDREVLFSTQIGRAMIKARFEMKDMKYHGKLAV
jgi:hypothetical protein